MEDNRPINVGLGAGAGQPQVPVQLARPRPAAFGGRMIRDREENRAVEAEEIEMK